MSFFIITQKVVATTVASTLLLLPLIVRAHGGVDDGDGTDIILPVDASLHEVGADELLSPSDPRWWYLITVSLLLIALLSRIVRKYIQVETPKKIIDTKPEKEK